MADEQNNPKDQTKVGGAPSGDNLKAEVNGSVIDEADQANLDEIDSAINKIDPIFQSRISKIGPNEEMTAAMAEGFSLDLSGDTLLIKPPFAERAKDFPRAAVVFLKNKIVTNKEKISDSMRTFKYSSSKKKMSILSMAALFVVASYIGYKAVTKGLFPHEEELFIGSLKDWSQESISYEPNDVESLFESNHSLKNMMEIPRMIVNIRRSKNSGENPMAALEFYLEGTDSDVMVEVKDREAEVKDLLQRSIEEMNFDQISSGEGKQLLCERLRKEVNKILTKGKIRRFFIKTAIVKP